MGETLISNIEGDLCEININVGSLKITNCKSDLSAKIDIVNIAVNSLHGSMIIFTGKGQIQLNNIIGNVTMDSFVLDITNLKENFLKEGEYLCLLDNNNIKKILNNLDLISYELLTLMGDRLSRQYNS